MGCLADLEVRRGSAVDSQRDRALASGPMLDAAERKDRWGMEQVLQMSCWAGTLQAHVCSQTVGIVCAALL
jgi:hypothetical protein